jgi:hypothetical protein
MHRISEDRERIELVLNQVFGDNNKPMAITAGEQKL